MMTVIGPLLTLLLVLAFRLHRPARERPLSARFLWLAPAIYLGAILALLVTHPPSLLGWTLLLVGVLLGGGAGWLRGRLFRLRVDEAAGRILLRRSRWAATMLMALVSARFLANLWIEGPSNTLLLTDLTLGLLFGLVAVTRLQVASRARHLRSGAVEQRADPL